LGRRIEQIGLVFQPGVGPSIQEVSGSVALPPRFFIISSGSAGAGRNLLEELRLGNRAPSDERDGQTASVPEPEGMVIYDPDHPLYEYRHVCFVLRKVSDALHGYTEAESSETDEY
jgi:hypothetical protein